MSMDSIKKAWVRECDGGLVELSLISQTVEPKGMRIKATEKMLGEPTSMHKVVIGLLSIDDLNTIIEAIENYMEEKT